jgi:hypothetical protein
MKNLRKLLEQSVTQHQQLHQCLTAIEKRLPLLDLESTVQATSDLDYLFNEIQKTDQQVLVDLKPMETDQYIHLIHQRLELGQTLVSQYERITPKLQTRLAGYKAELLKIRHGLQTMGGYANSGAPTGGLIDTSN